MPRQPLFLIIPVLVVIAALVLFFQRDNTEVADEPLPTSASGAGLPTASGANMPPTNAMDPVPAGTPEPPRSDVAVPPSATPTAPSGEPARPVERR